MADLRGLAKLWWSEPEIQGRLKNGGIGELTGIAKKTRAHCVSHVKVLAPCIHLMRGQGLLKTPLTQEIEKQVYILHLLSCGKAMDVNGELPPMDPDLETPLYLATKSVRRLVGFARRQFLRPHTPRDWGAKTAVTCFWCFWWLELLLSWPNRVKNYNARTVLQDLVTLCHPSSSYQPSSNPSCQSSEDLKFREVLKLFGSHDSFLHWSPVKHYEKRRSL